MWIFAFRGNGRCADAGGNGRPARWVRLQKMAILDCSSRKSRERIMPTISEILTQAQDRAQQAHLPYLGALTPQEAHAILTMAPQAKLVDVRARAEWDLTG